MAFALVEYECSQNLAKEGHVTKDHGWYLNVVTKSVTKFGYIILMGFGPDQTPPPSFFCNQLLSKFNAMTKDI